MKQSLLIFPCLLLILGNCSGNVKKTVSQPQTLDNLPSPSKSQEAKPKSDEHFSLQWNQDLETAFQQRAQQTIAFYQSKQLASGKKYGSTYGENEKKSYALAMLDFLAGNKEKALNFLQSEDPQADEEHQHTLGIDYYYAFTLKQQIRKYFYLGAYLNPAYQQRMFDGAKIWTEQEPKRRAHPIYGNGKGGEGWSPEIRGGWVDGRNTDNLRAMRETSVYLMAEETGNERTRQLYQRRLQRYVCTLYQLGMGEWDSENYLSHTFVPYLNLYDFAKDPEVRNLAKAALDWMAIAAALKYDRGGWAGPVKRDYGGANVVYGANAARFFWLYFGDNPQANPEPDRDLVHAITSTYRPPVVAVNLARKQFKKPLELLATKPLYENWLSGGEDAPGYWETQFFGNSYQMGSIAGPFADGDVSPFKLLANNSTRGVDYVVVNTGGNWVQPGKNGGDEIGQFRNLLIWLRPMTNIPVPFFFQLPKTAKMEREDGIWFWQLEKTWLAVRPFGLSDYTRVEITNQKFAQIYRNEQTFKAELMGTGYGGFTLEVGEESGSTYAQFKKNVKNKSKLIFDQRTATVQLQGSEGDRLTLRYNLANLLPQLERNGIIFNWRDHFPIYDSNVVSLGWKQGKLKVEVEGKVWETNFCLDRPYRGADFPLP